MEPIMIMKFKPLLLAVGLGLGIASGTASAGITWFPGVTAFQDDNLEWLYKDVSGATGTGAADGKLGVGDQLFSVIEIVETFSPLAPLTKQAVTGGELTGLSVIEVTGKFGGIGGVCTALSPCTYTFGVVTSAGGMNQIVKDVTGTDFGLAAGAMAALWFDTGPATDLDTVTPNCISLADCATKGSNGALWEVDGFGGDGDNLWLATGVVNDDLSAVAMGNATAKFGSYNFALDVLFNGTGQTLEPTNCVPFCGTGAGADGFAGVTGSGDVLGGVGLTNGAFGRSDFDFQKQSVPEPGTLALVGLAILSMGASLRKRVR
jgi:hypothetical protein